MFNEIFFILIVSLAGSVIGSFIGIVKKPSEKFLYIMIAFAAGVMISLAFLELIPASISTSSKIICAVGFLGGAVIMWGFDKITPHIHPEMVGQEQGKHLKKTAGYLLAGIFLHNFPEGIVIGIGSIASWKSGLIAAIAIAVHHIPEGICTSAPYYYLTKKRGRAFLISASTLIPTLIGFLLAYFVFGGFSNNILGLIIGATAGVLVYISGDELIPGSSDKVTSHSTIFSFIFGVVFVIIMNLF